MATIQHNGAERKLTPLLMKDFLVAQTLKGLKTQTRRLNGLEEINNNLSVYNYDPAQQKFIRKDGNPTTVVTKYPYGKLGDVIWVRESVRLLHHIIFNSREAYEYRDGSNSLYEIPEDAGGGIPMSNWKPSMYMPKQACRLFLEITDIRPERLQEITEEDAKEEGIFYSAHDNSYYGQKGNANTWGSDFPKIAFLKLWDFVNGKDANLLNPWVWRIQFKQIPKPANWPA